MKLKRCSSFVLAVAAMALTIPVADRAAAGPQQDALTAARFSIMIDGFEIAAFSELKEITTSVDLVESEDGSVLGGVTSSNAAVLRRGLTRSLELEAWQEAVLLGGQNARKSCSLTMYNSDGNPVARYHFEHAWPSKIEVGALKAGASEVLMETVTIVAERIRRVAV